MKPLLKGETGAKLHLSSRIYNPKGDVRKILGDKWSLDTLEFKDAYFSNLNPSTSKKWKMDAVQSQYFSVAYGQIGVICISEKNSSFVYEEFYLNDEKMHGILVIPPNVIYGIWSGNSGAVILNLLKQNYQDKHKVEITRKFPLKPSVITKGKVN